MKLLVRYLRALCIALLLPATVMASAQTDHAPARHGCCDVAAPASHHDDAAADAAIMAADPAPDDHGDRGDRPPHLSCDLHACNWIDGPGIFAARPLGLSWERYAGSPVAAPPPARAESLHRPPAALS